jgi:hypothetical protein
MVVFNSLVNYPAQRPCLGYNIFAYHKDLLFVFDLETICLVYIKIYDDLLYGIHNFYDYLQHSKTMIKYKLTILYLVLQHYHVDFKLP